MKTLVAFLCSLTFITTTAFADDPIVAGKAALEKGDFLTAISKFRDAVDKNKKNPEAYILLGTALVKADSLDQAVQTLVQARELDTANASVYALLGDVYSKQKIYRAAMDQYKKASDIDTKNKDIFLKLLDVSKRSRQYNEAVDAGLHALSLDSTNVTALSEVGNIYMRAKKYQNAAPIYASLVRLQPDNMNYQINYVKALDETRNCEKLIPFAEAIVKKDAAQTEIQTILAKCYNATGQNDKVVLAYESLPIDGLAVNDMIRYAKALKSQEKYDKALEVFQKALAKDSARCDIPYDLGTTFMKVKKFPDAVRMFEKKIACDTSSGYQFASHLNSAMSLMQLKNFREAKGHIEKSIEYRPDNVTAWKTLAQDLAQMDIPEEEINAYKKVIELATAGNENGDPTKYNPDLEEAYRMIGVRYLLDATKAKEGETNRKYAASLEYLEKALQINPRDCQMLLWAGQASQNSNNKEKAKRYYCRLIKACPDSKQADDAKKFLEILGMKCEE